MLESQPQSNTRPLRNPAANALLRVAPGARLELEWDIVNPAPFVARFELQCESFPSQWLDTSRGHALLPAHSGGVLQLIIAPPVDAADDNHLLKIRIANDDHTALEIALNLQIAADSQTIESETVFDEHLGDNSPSPSENETAPTSPPIDQNPYGANANGANQNGTARQSELPLVVLRAGAILSDDDNSDELVYDEPNVLEAPEGALLSLRPGSTLLLRFLFHNDAPRARNFVLEEDRSLDTEWLTLVQDEINISRDQGDELSLRLHPPNNARPGDYPFGVRLGVEGGTLSQRNLTLRIQATPAVALKCGETRQNLGPFRRLAPFDLSIESAGNTDTAFRLAAYPSASTSQAKSGKVNVEETETARRELRESTHWQFFFDQEIDSLESLSPNRPPKARPIQFRARRKGVWWWGFVEKMRVRVQAIPVTDAQNGGHANNSIELQATRWRPYPIPLRLLLPLVFLPALLLLGRPQNVLLDNPTYISPNNTQWIAGPVVTGSGSVKTNLRWQAPPLSLITLSATGDEPISPRLARSPQPLEVTFPIGQRSVYNVYRVSRLIGGGEQIKTRFVATRPDTPLIVSDVFRRPIDGSTLVVNVPTSGRVVLRLSNAAVQDFAINYWVARRPGPAFFVNDLNDEGSLRPEDKYGLGAEQIIKITRGTGGRIGDTDELVLVTTDAFRSVLRIKLKLDNAVFNAPTVRIPTVNVPNGLGSDLNSSLNPARRETRLGGGESDALIAP